MNKLIFQNGIVLAPMVRLGTTPFRLLCLRHGADIVFTEELISFKLAYCQRVENKSLNSIDFVIDKNNKKSLVLRIANEERGKIIVQIGANDPDIALKAALVVKDDVIGVDVNMGCPKHFSTHGNMGSNLIYLPELASNILKKLRENLSILVSCKIRIHEKLEDTLKFVKVIESTGIDFFTVHFRTKYQTAENQANWKIIPEVFKNKSIPMLISGDIFCLSDYDKVSKCKN